MDQRIRVLIADDHPRSRRGLRVLLRTWPRVDVLGEAEDGLEAVRLVEECRPDVVLMDVQMPELDGIEAARHIKARWPEVKVIVLTVHATHQAEALSAGVDGFLVKGCTCEELFAAIQFHAKGQREPEGSGVGKQSDTPEIKRANPRQSQVVAAALIR